MSRHTHLIRVIKFLIVGLFNTLFGFSIYALFILNNYDYKVAITLSTILGVMFNYVTTGRLVFNYKKFDKVIPYLLVYVATYLLNISLITILLFSGFNELVSGGISLIPVSISTYLLLNKYVYTAKKILIK